jgi:alpha-tubulin suppressor-like RCC1 family protein
MAHTALLSSTGEVFCFGRNDWGQLGTGTKVSKKTPFKIPFDKEVVSVACGMLRFLYLELRLNC